MPILSERKALEKLLPLLEENHTEDDFLEIMLSDFSVYNKSTLHGVEMKSLHHLDTKTGHTNFLFDGVLSVGNAKVYVQGANISAMPIGNYEDTSLHTARDSIWLLSPLNAHRELYYRLGSPAKEYRRFYDPFLWVADLGKHFVDFLSAMGQKRKTMDIHSFREMFSLWLRHKHGNTPDFLQWLEQHPSPDFRTSIVANLAYLHKEAVGVLGEKRAYYHALWSEIWAFDRYTPVSGGDDMSTIVTQYTYDCFHRLPFGDRLQVLPLSDETRALRDGVIQKRHLERSKPLHEKLKHATTSQRDRVRAIKPGVTISTHRDEETSGSLWKREISRGCEDVDRWFALVNKVCVNGQGERSFEVTWYYRPIDTICGLMRYPWNNELFLSDHCSCAEREKIQEHEVLGVHDVHFHGTSQTHADFFCRQTYIYSQRKWITLKDEHLRCEHLEERLAIDKPRFAVGETVLVHLDSKDQRSEPCEVISFSQARGKGQPLYRLRRLLRRKDADSSALNARVNELLYTHNEFHLKEYKILGRCFVRFFKIGSPVSTPYDRNGVGAYFFITHQQHPDGSVRPLETFPTSLLQGHKPDTNASKLRGLDLFCGGGNFGRGLEDGGGIKMQWANDFNTKAMHTYMANVARSDATCMRPFLGSIDELQRLALQGKFSKSVPYIGEVDFISGGSPCPGFSLLTNDKTTVQQRKNQSLVAAFASFVDLYRPIYGLLENVRGIVQSKANRDQDVFSQLICSIVGLGYQCQFFFLEASTCGSAQRRARVFVAFAAPGYNLPAKPMQTHSLAPHTKLLSLGKLPNGQPMAESDDLPATPFKFVSAQEATADLPPIHDAKPDICVPFPDHRVSIGQTAYLRKKMYHIPIRPYGMNFARAWYGHDLSAAGSGPLTAAERDVFPADRKPGLLSRTTKNSNAYGRQHPHRLIETVTTSQSPSDSKNGRTMHWEEHTRVLSIMEARRAQGFRDEDVLLGSPAEQFKIVGNSVAREVAVALGCAFRQAWIDSQRRDKEGEKGQVIVAHRPSETIKEKTPEEVPEARSRPALKACLFKSPYATKRRASNIEVTIPRKASRPSVISSPSTSARRPTYSRSSVGPSPIARAVSRSTAARTNSSCSTTPSQSYVTSSLTSSNLTLLTLKNGCAKVRPSPLALTSTVVKDEEEETG